MKNFAKIISCLVIVFLASCSKDSDELGDASLFSGTWECEEVSGLNWFFSNENENMYIGSDGHFNYQSGFSYEVLAKPYSIVFRAYDFNDIDNPISVVVARYNVEEITDTDMKLKRTYSMPQNENPNVANPFAAYPATLSFEKVILFFQ